jgi:hypothetical protein
VNLLKSEDNEDKVWGMAYEIDQKAWNEEVMQHLDHR